MRNKTFTIMMLLPLSLAAQESIGRLWQQMPDDIVPLLSKTNRLDMIDFCENSMEARVSNLLDGQSTMDTLTQNYLHVTLSPQTTLEMRLTADSTIVAVRTAAALSSTIIIYNKDWQETGTMPLPAVSEFLPADANPQLVQALETVPLITARLSPDDDSVTFTLHTDELSRDDRKEAAPLIKEVKASVKPVVCL